MIHKVLTAIRSCFILFVARCIAIKHYDRKYLDNRWFHSDYPLNLTAEGWEWVYYDYWGNFRQGTNKYIPWPVSPRSIVTGWKNIVFDPDDLNIFQSNGCYFQAVGTIKIGKGTYIAPNVGLITANHMFLNLDVHQPAKPIEIGENCWIGMNSMILPGVKLGARTIVAAGSVVTKSFMGNCVIAGNPAKVIKELNINV